MAHLFKPKYTRAIPRGAEHFNVKGSLCVRWRGRGNKWVVGEVCEGDRSRCRVESPKWYVSYADAGGRQVSVPAYADRAASESLMGELVRTTTRRELQCAADRCPVLLWRVL